MCKPDKSFNTGVKTSYFSSHESALQEQPCRRGSAPYRRSDWTSRLWAMSKPRQFKTTCCVRALSLEHLLLTLLKLACNSSSLANAGRTARWNLASRPAEINNTRVNQRLCKHRNDATISTQNQHQTISEISTPR